MSTTKRPRRRRRQRDTGSLRERVPGKWQLRYKTATAQVFAADRSEAAEQLQKFVDRVRNGGLSGGRRMTFNELADLHLKSKERSKAATTVAWYRRNLKQHVRPAIGGLVIDKILAVHVEQLVSAARNGSKTKQRGKPLGATTANNLLIAVRAVLGYGVKKKLLTTNVAKDVELVEASYVERPVVSVDDVKALLAASAGTELEAVVPTAVGTGLRRAELSALRWSDLDLDTGVLRVRRAAAVLDGKVIIKEPKTKRSQRTDHLPPFVVEILRRYKAEQLERLEQQTSELEARRRQRDGYVFTRWSGEPWNPNELSRQFSRLVRRKKLPLFRLHDLRHGFASLAFAAGVSLKVVSESLGHAGIGITSQLYVHLLADQKREKAAILDAYLDRAVRPHATAEPKTGT